MTRSELASKVAVLRAEGLFHREIGERLGISISYAAELATDPEGLKVRARKDGYRGTCVECGAPTDGSNGPAAPERCKECLNRKRNTEAADRMVRAIQRFHERYDRAPAAPDFDPNAAARLGHGWRVDRFHSDGDYPWAQTVLQVMGSWNAAIEAAGFSPRRVGTHLADFTPEQVAEMVRLYEDGMSSPKIAKRFGCSANGVRYRLLSEGVQMRKRWDRVAA